ncbi:MAG: hypothetical protein WCR91_01770 [Sphaerochaetaceae bacterium]|nr:hypothetical protein [Spirochaetales bacterium]
MKNVLKHAATDIVCLLLITSMIGCSFQWDPAKNASLDEEQLISEVTQVIDEQLQLVAPQLEHEFGNVPHSRDVRSLDEYSGQEIVEMTLQEELGSDYVKFCHAVASGRSTDEILASAKSLMDATQFEELAYQTKGLQKSFSERAVLNARALPPNQRAPFLRDLQKLLTKTIVLLTAGIVYACIPTTILWGKITAAAAVSVAAGIVATSVLSIYRYYKYGQDSLAQSFQEWIIDVTKDPTAAYALAASMTSVGKTMTKGPVVTGLIIVVFALYQVIDMVKPMLKKYNFDA